ncbi:DUF2946 domain-containing protein [Paraburkholderia phosphatilytica]|uniref:DUF2946 domain-containing protein n=1 Tax=Paraburkholderia phosphatilytica TaxID=2282883 RepID=UPI000E504985|nr:DUF2946 domain-containing protein [Paraburkholderia phosphatilytica]
MHTRRLQKLGSLLGLLAILMATLAPTISQTLAWNHRLDVALDTYCTVSADSDAGAAHGGKTSRSAALHLQACAYCSLLAHVPTVPHAATPLAVALAETRAPAAAPHAAETARFSYAVAQPRAPPSFS